MRKSVLIILLVLALVSTSILACHSDEDRELALEQELERITAEKAALAQEYEDLALEKAASEQELEELILLGLRRREGIPLSALKALFGSRFQLVIDKIETYFDGYDSVPGFSVSQTEKLLSLNNNCLCLTFKGLLIYDSICAKIVEICCE